MTAIIALIKSIESQLKMEGRKHLKIWLLIAFAIETLCATYFLKLQVLAGFASILYFLSGIGIAVIILFLPKAKNPAFNVSSSYQNYFRFFLIASIAVFLYWLSNSIINENSLDFHNADMLPVIKKMDQRFLNGQWKHVYDNIPELWNGTQPIYLPAMWVPFAPAVALNIDVRWITVACLFFVFAATTLILSFKQKSSYIILLIAGILLCWLLLEDDTHSLISFSEEGPVVLHYFLLVFALVSENIFFIGIAACLCMLSRYSLVGWLPAFFIFLLINKKNKQAFIFTFLGMLSFLFLFIIPFGWDAFLHFLQLPNQYIDFSKIVWRDSPEVFLDNLGFAKFFEADRMNVLHLLLIGFTFIIPSAFILFCNYYTKKKSLSNIPLAALKIALVIFYNFIDVPYLYLFYTSTVVSLAIVAIFMNENNCNGDFQSLTAN